MLLIVSLAVDDKLRFCDWQKRNVLKGFHGAISCSHTKDKFS